MHPMGSPQRSPQKAMGSSISLPHLPVPGAVPQMMTYTESFSGLRKTQQIQSGVINKLPVLAKILGGKQINKGPSANDLLMVYVRVRETVTDLHSTGRRVPQSTSSELQSLEDQLCSVLPHLNPRFFQRLDRAQLCKALRSMSVARLSLGKWVFGQGPSVSKDQQAAFLLISGTVRLFHDDPMGPAETEDIDAGVIFGPRKVHHEQSPQIKTPTCDKRAVAARAESNVTVGILSMQVISSAMGGGDRLVVNSRVEQVLKSLRLFNDLDDILLKHMKELARHAQTLMVQPGAKLLAQEAPENQFLVVTKGVLQVKGDIYVEEAPKESGPAGRRRLKVYIENGRNLAGDSIFDKLDPYCVAKLSPIKRFQTPVQHNAGTEPIWKHTGAFLYDGEDGISFEVFDYDRFSSDDFCGSGFLKYRDFEKGFEGEVKLTLKKKNVGQMMKGFVSKKGESDPKKALQEFQIEPAGQIHVKITWEAAQRSAAEIAALAVPRKSKSFPKQLLFEYKERECWGHEAIFLGDDFMPLLERAAMRSGYLMSISNLTLEASASGGEFHVMRFPRREVLDFFKKFGQRNQMMNYCKIKVLAMEVAMRNLLTQLTKKWMIEETKKQVFMESNRAGGVDDITKDLSRFRVAFRGAVLKITIQSGINLEGGSWMDKLDPYAVAKLRGGGSQQKIRTPAKQDAGPNPVWDHEGMLTYGGEDTLEFFVYDEDQYSADDLVAIGELKLAMFTDGYEGIVELRAPKEKKSKKKEGKTPKSAGMLVISIEWSLSDEIRNQMDPALLQ